MLHNGIEQGHLSILAEAHHLLHCVAGLSNADVADIFDDWNGTNKLKETKGGSKGGAGKELTDNFLVKVRAKYDGSDDHSLFMSCTQIGAEILRFRHGDGIDLATGIVDGIEDKVTQDIDNSEGTGVWSLRRSR